MKHLHKPVTVSARKPTAPRQLTLGFAAPQLWTMQVQERQMAIARLAAILMQAAGVVPAEEDGDDRR